MSRYCSKHVDAYNKLITKQYCALNWLITKIILRCTVSKTSKLLGAFAKLRKATINFAMFVCLSVRPPTWNNSDTTKRIFMKFYISLLVKTCGENSKFTKHRQEEKKYINLRQHLDDFFAKRQKVSDRSHSKCQNTFHAQQLFSCRL